jgi:hypothetical protein
VIRVELNEIRMGGSLFKERAEVLRCCSSAVENYLTAARQNCNTAAHDVVMAAPQHGNAAAHDVVTATRQHSSTAALNIDHSYA